VFLGIDHNFSDTDNPILFETMVFDCRKKLISQAYDNLPMVRYSTYDEAVIGHREIVEEMKSGINYGQY
jgi:hypothetical protein